MLGSLNYLSWTSAGARKRHKMNNTFSSQLLLADNFSECQLVRFQTKPDQAIVTLTVRSPGNPGCFGSLVVEKSSSLLLTAASNAYVSRGRQHALEQADNFPLFT